MANKLNALNNGVGYVQEKNDDSKKNVVGKQFCQSGNNL